MPDRIASAAAELRASETVLQGNIEMLLEAVKSGADTKNLVQTLHRNLRELEASIALLSDTLGHTLADELDSSRGELS